MKKSKSPPKLNFSKAPIILKWCALIISAQGLLFANEPQIFRPERRASLVEVQDSSKTGEVLLNVNIFGDIPVGSYYILWDEVDLSDEMKKLMTTRDFARDEFFMQNIDREEFEQERMLLLFEDRKREFFRMYPEEALKELEEEASDE